MEENGEDVLRKVFHFSTDKLQKQTKRFKNSFSAPRKTEILLFAEPNEKNSGLRCFKALCMQYYGI